MPATGLPLDWKPPEEYFCYSPPEGYAALVTADTILFEDLITGEVVYDPQMEKTPFPPGANCFPVGSGVHFVRAVELRGPALPVYLKKLRNSFIVAPKAFPSAGRVLHWAALKGGSHLAQPIVWDGSSATADYYPGGIQGLIRKPPTPTKLTTGQVLWSNINQSKRPDGRFSVTLQFENGITPVVQVILADKQLPTPQGCLTGAYMGVIEYQGTGTVCGNLGPTVGFKDVSLTLSTGAYANGADWQEWNQFPVNCRATTTLKKNNPGGSVIFRFPNMNTPC
jgi:hypothetical protein